jgi:GNAT superfamily N-acetyltransferase
MAQPAIRPLGLDDADAVARLITQLGYPATRPQVRARLEQLARESCRAAFVAERAGRVAGVIGVRVEGGYEFDGLIGRIDVLVVHESLRGRGIGRALVSAGEQWLRRRGASRVLVSTAHRRVATHRFYESLGYESTGLRFGRSIGARPSGRAP